MPMNPRLLRPTQGGFSSPDADARAYLAAVRIADGSNLEPAVAKAISDFVIGCKSDGIWNAIKASCILAGARTLAGALVPLKGAAPTNNGPFVSGDYNRETGLVGNQTTKYLDSNRASNADPQDNHHAAVFVSTSQSAVGAGAYLGAGGFGINGTINIGSNAAPSGNVFFRGRSSFLDEVTGTAGATGFVGLRRNVSTKYDHRVSGAAGSVDPRGSSTSLANNTFVFGRNVSDALQLGCDARLAFYSIGESLDLALLDTRVSGLITAIGVAIP
jgi:hypothetical protein